MGKKYKNLFHLITTPENLREAYRRASKGKRATGGFLAFKEFEETNLDNLRTEVEAGTYRQGTHTVFTIREPKKRTISALPFRDRIVQHALCAVIGPIFEKGMLPSSHACREGRGTHSGAKQCQAHIRAELRAHGSAHILKTDFSGYFYNIDRAILWRLIKAKISCKKTLSLIAVFLPSTGRGIPIGNLTSQLFANVFGTAVDRFLAQGLRVKRFIRYMDDIVVIHHNAAHLHVVRQFLQTYCASHLKMLFSKSYIKNHTQGIDFLGYRIFKHYKLLRKDSVTRARRKIKRYTLDGNTKALRSFFSAFTGHAKHADARNLMATLINYQRGVKCSLNIN